MDLQVIHPPACLCLRTVKPNRAIKKTFCAVIPPQPASSASCPPESLLSPGCWVPASHHCSLLHANSQQHLSQKKTHSRLWAWPLSSRAVSGLYLAYPLPWVSTPGCWCGQPERVAMSIEHPWGGLGGCSVFLVTLPCFSPLLPSWHLSHFLTDFHTESLIQAKRAALKEGGRGVRTYANEYGAPVPSDSL